MGDSLFDKILNGDVSLTVARDNQANDGPSGARSTSATPESDVSEKAIGGRLARRNSLGGKLGQGLLAAPPGMVYVDITGAIDGDGDGMVFDRTPYQRPIIPRALIPKNIAQAQEGAVLERAIRNEEKRRGADGKRREMTERDAAQLQSRRRTSEREIAGSQARTDRYPVLARELDDIFDDLEMTKEERGLARRQLSEAFETAGEILAALKKDSVPEDIFPYLTKTEAIELLESISLSISTNGIPMISFMKHPFYAKFSGDRDYRSVEILSFEKIRELMKKIDDSKDTPAREVFKNYGEILFPLTDLISQDTIIPPEDADNIWNIAEKLGIPYSKLYVFADNIIDLVISSLTTQQGRHDGREHLSTGRGFDRHGEWAAGLARMQEMRRNLEAARDLYNYLINNPQTSKTRQELIDEYAITEQSLNSILYAWMKTDKDDPSTLFNLTDEVILTAVLNNFANSNLDSFLARQIKTWSESSGRDSSKVDDEILVLQTALQSYLTLPNLMRTFKTLDEFFDFIDPRDENGKYINGSRSTTRQNKYIGDIKQKDIEAIVDEMPAHHVGREITGSRSRIQPIDITTIDSIIELDRAGLTQDQIDVATGALADSIPILRDLIGMLNSGSIPESAHPGLTTNEMIKLLKSFKLAVSSNGVPMILFDKHPLFSRGIVGERNWSLIEAPSPEDAVKMLTNLRRAIDSGTVIKSGDEIGLLDYGLFGLTDLPNIGYHKLFREIFPDMWQDPGLFGDGWLGEGGKEIKKYLLSRSQANPTASPIMVMHRLFNPRPSDGHDMFEHMAIGRGFDRHGEWAAMLAAMNRIYNDDSLSEYQKRWLLLDYLTFSGLQQIILQMGFGEDPSLVIDSPIGPLSIRNTTSLQSLFKLRQVDMATRISSDEIMSIVDPVDDKGVAINGSRSRTKQTLPLFSADFEQLSAAARESAPHHIVPAISKNRERRDGSASIDQLVPTARNGMKKQPAGKITITNNVMNDGLPFRKSPIKRMINNIVQESNNINNIVGSQSRSDVVLPNVRSRAISDITKGRGHLVLERVTDLAKARRSISDQMRYLEPKLGDYEAPNYEQDDSRYSQLEDILSGIDAEIDELISTINYLVGQQAAADTARSASRLANELLDKSSSDIRNEFDFTDSEMENIKDLLRIDSKILREMLSLSPSRNYIEKLGNDIQEILDEYEVSVKNNLSMDGFDPDMDEDVERATRSAHDILNHAVSMVARKKGIDSVRNLVIDVEVRDDEQLSDRGELPSGSKSSTSRSEIEAYLSNDLTADDTLDSMVEKFNIPPRELNNIILRMGGLGQLRRNRGIAIGNRSPEKKPGTVSLERHLLDSLRETDTASSLAKEFEMPVERAQAIINRMGGIRRLRQNNGISFVREKPLNSAMDRLEEHVKNNLRDTDTIESLANEFGVSFGRAQYRINIIGGLRKIRSQKRRAADRADNQDNNDDIDAAPGSGSRTDRRVPDKVAEAIRNYLNNNLQEGDTMVSLASEFGVSPAFIQREVTKFGGMTELRYRYGFPAKVPNARRKIEEISENEQRLIDHIENNLRSTDSLQSLSDEFGIPVDKVRDMADGLGGFQRLKRKLKASTRSGEAPTGSKSSTRPPEYDMAKDYYEVMFNGGLESEIDDITLQYMMSRDDIAEASNNYLTNAVMDLVKQGKTGEQIATELDIPVALVAFVSGQYAAPLLGAKIFNGPDVRGGLSGFEILHSFFTFADSLMFADEYADDLSLLGKDIVNLFGMEKSKVLDFINMFPAIRQQFSYEQIADIFGVDIPTAISNRYNGEIPISALPEISLDTGMSISDIVKSPISDAITGFKMIRFFGGGSRLSADLQHIVIRDLRVLRETARTEGNGDLVLDIEQAIDYVQNEFDMLNASAEEEMLGRTMDNDVIDGLQIGEGRLTRMFDNFDDDAEQVFEELINQLRPGGMTIDEIADYHSTTIDDIRNSLFGYSRIPSDDALARMMIYRTLISAQPGLPDTNTADFVKQHSNPATISKVMGIPMEQLISMVREYIKENDLPDEYVIRAFVFHGINSPFLARVLDIPLSDIINISTDEDVRYQEERMSKGYRREADRYMTREYFYGGNIVKIMEEDGYSAEDMAILMDVPLEEILSSIKKYEELLKLIRKMNNRRRP